jgi:hypothetical protein
MECWSVAVLNMGRAGVHAVRSGPTKKRLLENLCAYICVNLRLDLLFLVRLHLRSTFH